MPNPPPSMLHKIKEAILDCERNGVRDIKSRRAFNTFILSAGGKRSGDHLESNAKRQRREMSLQTLMHNLPDSIKGVIASKLDSDELETLLESPEARLSMPGAVNEFEIRKIDTKEGANTILRACEENNTEIVRSMLTKGMSRGYELRHVDFDECMFQAVEHNNPQLLSILLDNLPYPVSHMKESWRVKSEYPNIGNMAYFTSFFLRGDTLLVFEEENRGDGTWMVAQDGFYSHLDASHFPNGRRLHLNDYGDQYLALFGITDRSSEDIVMEWKDAPTIDKAKTILTDVPPS